MMKDIFRKPESTIGILLLGMFTFLFLGSEYMYVNMLSLTAGKEETVIAQNYALGASAAGFLLFPLFHRFCKKSAQSAGLVLLAAAALFCNFFIQKHASYSATLISGMALFLLLGLWGGVIHFLFFQLAAARDYLARMVGCSYALGICLQFMNNNLVKPGTAEILILSFSLFAVLALIAIAEKLCPKEMYIAGCKAQKSPLPSREGSRDVNRKKLAAGWLLLLLVILMACIFSTLDNAVTLHHAAGTSIGQWPRLLLAVSGLVSGFLFDLRKRKYMTLMMYCVMLLSVICVAVLRLSGPFLVGLIVFYLSAGFFVVFFTTGFLDLASHMQTPYLWTGMGRAMNNLGAALLTNGSVILLISDNNDMVAIILVLILFVAISVVIALYTTRMLDFSDAATASEEARKDPDPQEAFRILAASFDLTPREASVFDKLVNSEESIQEIADSLYLSRRTCQRHITAIYQKAGVKSRMGLYQLYREKQRRL